ncbi:MAG: tetratricopeptide repeat protein [Candidatus Aminicenantes bacterium]
MKKLFSMILISLVFVSLIFTATLNVQARVWAMVEGTVESEEGKPIQGALVIMIFSEDGTKYEITTDQEGKWKKANLRPGKWTIGFMAEGYEPQNINVKLSAIRKNPPIHIKLSAVPESSFSQGDALYSQHNYSEALEEYQRVLEENPDLYQAYDKIGLCYYRMGELDKAIQAFKHMLEHQPQSRNTLINLSAIYFQKGSLEEGMKYFRQLDEKSLTDPGTFYNVGLLLFKNGEIDMAIDYFHKSLTLDSAYIDSYYQLGLANLNKGNMEEAKKNFHKVIELAPQSEKAALSRNILKNIK